MKQAAVLKVCSRPTVSCCSTMNQERMVSEDDLIAAFNMQTTSDDASSATALNSGINIIQPGSSSSTTAGEIAPPSPSSSTIRRVTEHHQRHQHQAIWINSKVRENVLATLWFSKQSAWRSVAAYNILLEIQETQCPFLWLTEDGVIPEISWE